MKLKGFVSAEHRDKIEDAFGLIRGYMKYLHLPGIAKVLLTKRNIQHTRLRFILMRRIAAKLTGLIDVYCTLCTSVVDPDPHSFCSPGSGFVLERRFRIQDHGN
jgi:hypothetical protein